MSFPFAFEEMGKLSLTRVKMKQKKGKKGKKGEIEGENQQDKHLGFL